MRSSFPHSTSSSSSSSSSSGSSPSFAERLKREVDEGGATGLSAPSQSRSALPLTERSSIPTDTIVYDIYDTDFLSSFSSSPSVPSSLPSLTNLRTSLLSCLPPYLSSYLWHDEPFVLHPSPTSLPHLHGHTHTGDSLDDRYLITSLLFSLSASNPSLLIHVEDSDGAFLLIDAADALPSWAASPSEMEHRVWVSGGKLRVIPVKVGSRVEAIDWLMEEKERGGRDSEIPSAMQLALSQRMSPYPQVALTHNSHHVRCFLPLSVVRILQADYSVLTGALQAFYTRDLLDMRIANKMARLLPSSTMGFGSPPLSTTVVPYRLRFSWLLYAQVESQPFTLPRSLLSLAALKPFASLPVSSPPHHAFALGMKVMAGMEIHLHNLTVKRQREDKEKAAQHTANAEREQRRKEKRRERAKKGPMTGLNVEREMRGNGEKKRRWKGYLSNLEELGWFKGTKKGEELWQQQMTLGWIIFEEEEEKREEEERKGEEVVHAMTELERRHLQAMEGVLGETRAEEVERKEVEGWAKWEDLEPDDSEEWLIQNAADVEAMMRDREVETQLRGPAATQSSGSSPTVPPSTPSEGAGAGKEEVKAAHSIVSGVQRFLSAVSSHEGAELPSDLTINPSPKGKDPNPVKASSKAKGGRAVRMERLMAALACDETQIEAVTRAYEADYGDGSFDRDLMDSVGHLQLDGDDPPETGEHKGGEEVKSDEMEDFTAEDEEEEEEEEEEGESDEEDEELLMFGEEKGGLRDYLSSMEEQLRAAGIGSEFERRREQKVGGEGEEEEGEGEDGEEGEGEVDEDLNLLKNLLQSFSSQQGMAGPTGNLLGAMGLRVPKEEKRNEKAPRMERGEPPPSS